MSMVVETLTPLLVNERQAARMLSLSSATMYRLRVGGGLPFVRIGTRVMYDPADLAAWRDRQKQTAGAPDPAPSGGEIATGGPETHGVRVPVGVMTAKGGN